LRLGFPGERRRLAWIGRRLGAHTTDGAVAKAVNIAIVAL
jgi:hypothetical protein